MARRFLIKRMGSGRALVIVEASNGRELVRTPELGNARAARNAIEALRRVAQNGDVADTTRRGAGPTKLAKTADAIVLERNAEGGTSFRVVARGKEIASSHPYTQAFWARAAVQRFRAVTSVAAIEEESADGGAAAPAKKAAPAKTAAPASKPAGRSRADAKTSATKPAAQPKPVVAAKSAPAKAKASAGAARKTAAKTATPSKPAASARAGAAKSSANKAAKPAAKSGRKKK